MHKALVIPVEGPITEIELGRKHGRDLEVLQGVVGGLIQALPVPDFIASGGRATVYVNEDGKGLGLPVNMRATDYMVPGIGLFHGDYISGPMVIAGFYPHSGNHGPLPHRAEDRARTIEREAGR